MPVLTLNLVELLTQHYCKTRVLLAATLKLDLHELLAAHRMIGILWQIDDVKVCRQDLSDEQCWEVLQQVERECDAGQGISWDAIQSTAYTLCAIPVKG